MTGIKNSQIQEVKQLIGNHIYLTDKIPIDNIQGIKLTANFWWWFFVYVIVSLFILFSAPKIMPLWNYLFPFLNSLSKHHSIIFVLVSETLLFITIALPILALFKIFLLIVDKKHSLQINDQYIKYKNQIYPLDNIFHIFQHNLFKSKVTIYYKRNDNFLSTEKFILRNEAEAYYLVRKVEEYKIQKQFLKDNNAHSNWFFNNYSKR